MMPCYENRVKISGKSGIQNLTGTVRKVINPLNVDGITDDKIIADNFAIHFEKVCTPSHVYDDLVKEYNERRVKYDEPLYGSKKSFLC